MFGIFKDKKAVDKKDVDMKLDERFYWGFLSYINSPNPKEQIIFDIYNKNTDLRTWIRDKNNIMFKHWFYYVNQNWEQITNEKLIEEASSK